MRLWKMALVGVLAVLFGGCAPDGINRGGEVSGKVTLDGKELPGGTITFHSADGKYAVPAELGPDGSYTVKEPPLGECKVTVKTEHLRGVLSGGGGKGREGSSPGMILPKDVGLGYRAIPPRYADPAKTDLTVEVKRGNQAHEVALSSKGS